MTPPSTPSRTGTVLVYTTALVSAASSWSLVRPASQWVIPVSFLAGTIPILVLGRSALSSRSWRCGKRLCLLFLLATSPFLAAGGRFLLLSESERLSTRPSYPVPGSQRAWNPPEVGSAVRLFGRPELNRRLEEPGGTIWFPLVDSEGEGTFSVWVRTSKPPPSRATWFSGTLHHGWTPKEAANTQSTPDPSEWQIPMGEEPWLLHLQEFPGRIQITGLLLIGLGTFFFLLGCPLLVHLVSPGVSDPTSRSVTSRFGHLLELSLRLLALGTLVVAVLVYGALSGRWGWYMAVGLLLAYVALAHSRRRPAFLDRAGSGPISFIQSIGHALTPLLLPLFLFFPWGRARIWRIRRPLALGLVFGLGHSAALFVIRDHPVLGIGEAAQFEFLPGLIDAVLLAVLAAWTGALAHVERREDPPRPLPPELVFAAVVALVIAPAAFFLLGRKPGPYDIDRVRAKVEHHHASYIEKATNLLHLFSQRSRRAGFRRDNREHDRFQQDLERGFQSLMNAREASLLRVAAYRQSDKKWVWLLFRLANFTEGWTIGDPVIRTPDGHFHQQNLDALPAPVRHQFLEEFDIWHLEAPGLPSEPMIPRLLPLRPGKTRTPSSPQ